MSEIEALNQKYVSEYSLEFQEFMFYVENDTVREMNYYRTS